MKKNCTSLKAYGLFCLAIVAVFTAGVVSSCNKVCNDEPISEDNRIILNTNQSDAINLTEGTMLIVKEVKGDTVTVDTVSDDDCRAQLENNGQG